MRYLVRLTAEVVHRAEVDADSQEEAENRAVEHAPRFVTSGNAVWTTTMTDWQLEDSKPIG